MNSRNIAIVLFALLTPSLAFAQGDEVEYPPYYGIGEHGYLGLSGYWAASKMPSGDWHHSGGPSLNYIKVDYNLAHMVTVDLGFGYNGWNNVTGGYGIAFGPRNGYLHGGILLEAGYSRFFDDDSKETIHAANIKASFIAIWTLPNWKRLQFFFKIGNSIQIFSTGNFDDPVNWRGIMAGAGITFHIDPFPLPTAD